MKPRLYVEQKITAFTNKYIVFNAREDGQRGDVTAFAQQKRIAFKEKVTFYTDESKTIPIFTLRAEKVFDVHGKYIVEDANGQQVGAFQKLFKQSLAKSTWQILDANGQPTVTVSENNLLLALLRRYVGIISDLADIIVNFFKYHFVFTNSSGSEVGRYEKITLFRDHYRFSADDSLVESVDWRVLAAVAVALDALQSR